MPVPTYQVRCLKKELIARNVYEFHFEKPEGFTFIPGQFVLFEVPLVDDPSDVQTRAYSIASATFEEELRFVIKFMEGGRASSWFKQVVEEGTEVTIKGPFGVFTFRHESPRDTLFIATSTGIAPFRSHVLDRLKEGDTRQFDLIFGVRSEQDIFWQDELEKLSEKHPNFHLHLSLGEPSDSWTGHRDRVQEMIPKIIPNIHDRDLYICGSPAMTKDVKTLCKETWGVDAKHIHVEGYI